MRKVLLFALTILISNVYGQGKSYDYCYQVGPASFNVYSITDKKEYPILTQKNKASYACISPDGKSIVYTFSTWPKGISNLAIMDLNTKRKKLLNAHNSDCDEPVWSPDGKYIAYKPWNEKQKKREIAVIAVDNKWQKVLTRKLPEIGNISWTSDSKKIVANDIDSIFVIDLAGNVTSIYKTAAIGKTKWCRNFRFTTDGKKIVFLQHENEIVNMTGGSAAVYVYDMATKKALRISPKGYDFDNIIIHTNKILASGEKGSGVPNSGIYSIDLDGKNFRLFFPKAGNISVKD
ncbi:MAG TPA: hypothetical protein VK668_23565 [Mucilaginibacter sp.]|nr:hypothetical protein [Mucilaginibacter sp.]